MKFFDVNSCAQERFAHAHHVICDLDQKFVYRCSSSHVRKPPWCCSATLFRCHCLNVCRTHHWELRCEPGWTDMSKTSGIDHQLVLLSLAIGLIFPIHRVLSFLAVFQREYPESLICTSNRVHLRQNLRRRVWCPSFFDLFTAVAFSDFCHFRF